MRRFAAILLVAASLAGCVLSAPQDAADIAPARAVYVTRHMDKAPGEDPVLSATGMARAERLADTLAGSGIAAIYATPTRRAMQTAAPLAQRLGIAVTPYDPRDPQALAELVAAEAGSVLVVGHSNTVPGLVLSLGGRPVAPIAEDDYGALYVIERPGETRIVAIEP